MDQQRPLLYLLLVFLGFLIWNQWQLDNAPKPPLAETAAVTTNPDGTAPNNDSGNTGDVPQQEMMTAAPSAIPQIGQMDATGAKNIRVKTDTLDLIINTKGGDIIRSAHPTYPVSIKEPDTPILILDPEKEYLAQSGLGHRQIAGTDTSALAPNHHTLFASEQDEYVLADGEDTLLVPLSWTNGKGITVRKTFTLKRGKFTVDVAHSIGNESGETWEGFEYRQLRHGPPAAVTGGIFGGVASFNGAAYYDFREGDYHYEKIPFKDFDDQDEIINNRKITGGWAAVLERHFLSAWVPDQQQENSFYTTFIPGQKGAVDNHIIGLKTPVVQIANGTGHTFHSTFYVGPKIKENLDELATGLDLAIDYGWLSVLSKPLFWILKQLYGIFGNWGWAIIFITVLIKLVFFYPSAVSYRSMAKLKKLTPKMKDLQERYKNDPQAKQKAMMEFYKKEKINPLGGCLPMLIQIPVFMALYFMLMESVELRQAPWILWYKDLSVMDPFLVLPILMGISMWVQHKLNPPQMDEMQKKIFAWLPWVFTVLFLWFPAGLVLYWVVNNILSIAQQWFINKRILGDDA